MSLRIRTNMQALNAQRHLESSKTKLSKHMKSLSSGYRINKAADDAAGLAISETMRADIRSYQQARRNSEDGISMIEIAEGSLDEITNIVVRLRELSIQSASDTIGIREREYLNMEFMALKDEIDRIAVGTEFNGTRLLTGSLELDDTLLVDHNNSPMEIQVGKDYLTPPDALSSANPVNIIRMDFTKMNATTDGEHSLGLGSVQNEDGTRIDNKIDAQKSIAIIDTAFHKIASYRAQMGALQNRLVSTSRNLGIVNENLSAARSRIKDADFAGETAQFTQANILMQAGTSVLAQAKQLPEVALQLLR